MRNKNKLGLPGGPNEIIVDSRGQWDNPGKNTRIPGNNITMKDVAYPVWAQPNVGPGTMMMPGSEHHFKNAEYVDEYPMMQEGGGVNEEGVEQYKWFKNYLQSPKYVERLKKEFPDYTDNQIGQEVKARLNNVMQTRVGFLPRSSEISTGVGGVQGVYNADEYPDSIMLRPEYSASTSDVLFEPGNYLSGYDTIPLHEWSHAADDGGNRMPQSTTDLMLSKMKENSLDIPKDKYYYTRPTEYLGRMQPLRYLMKQEGLYDAGKQYFTKEDLEKAKQNKTIKNNTHFQDLMKNVKSNEDFIELMNNVASADNMESSVNIGYAQDGGSTSWNWKGKSYSGTLIPSMETKKNRYARTKNGKIKTLPKAQYGLNGKFSLPTRDGVRLNYDNQGNVIGESSHIMKAEIFEGKWYAFPTLFQNEDKSWNSTFEKMLQVDEKNWMPAFEEAKRRGELIEFGDDKEGAIKFGEGSWKPANLPEYQIKGEVMKPTFPFATAPTGDEQIQFLLDWTNSPRGQALMSKSLDGDQKDIEKLTFKRTDNLDTVRIGMNDAEGALGRYKPKGHTIAINQNLRDGKAKLIGNTEEDVLLHELSHSQDYSPNAEFNRNTMPFSDQKLINRLTKLGINQADYEGMSKSERKKLKRKLKYIGDPTETRARLNSIRYFYENNPIGKEKGMPSIFDSEVTPEMMEIMKDNTQFRELKEVYDNEEILDLLNTISYQDSDIDSSVYAKFGIELSQKAAGGPGPGLIQLLKQLKKLKNKGTKYFENLFGSTDNVAKAVVPATKQKGLYHMLPINKLDSPTHYGTVNINDGTVQNALDIMKAQGKYTDDIGYSIEDLVGENVQYLGNQVGRTIVNVPLPNGKSQMFYKSTDLAGKGTEGFWQPYAGHAKVLDFPSKSGTIKNDNWFIKDVGYKNFYDSQSFRDIAGNLDRIAAEQGWDMSQQILKSQLKFGGDLPQAQKGLKNMFTQARKYLDDALKQGVKQVNEVKPFTTNELIQDGWLPARNIDFKSSIDWGKWNKEILENKILMQEYNLIEETTKANKTWMKNADGSPFAGRPEQFIQIRSGNFQKAFPNAVLDDAGNPLINYHGSGSKFNAFDESKFYSGQYGKGIYTSPDRETILKSYADPSKNRTKRIAGKSGTDSPTQNLYELYINSKNPLTTDDIINFRNFGKKIDDLPSLADWKASDFGKKILNSEKYLKTDDDIISFIRMQTPSKPVKESFIDQGGDFLRAIDSSLQEGVTPFWNQMKSVIGNNGMFDMTNPNIYKKDGGESKPYKIYKNYVMGNTSDKNSEKIYDKLNRMHYREAKQAGMDVPNYIMTYLSGNS
tara:strand:- start:4162 stop:8124 length:3963 start_codon:yes stop_codon:yes gene_type:complete